MLPGLERNIPICEVMDPAHVEMIDNASMDILENIGIRFRDPIAVEDWRKQGAKIDGDMVYLDRGLIRELIKTIPEQFTYAARNRTNDVKLGGPNAIFVPIGGAPYIRDLDNVRRNATLADLNMMHKLCQMMPGIHSSSHHVVEPMDMPVSHRHLHITYSSMKYCDKTFMGVTTSGRNAEDEMAMCDALFGEGFIDDHPVITANCNANSPLVWDEIMLGCLRAFSRRNQPVLCCPFVLGGANTPASVPATLAQLNAEALSALAYTQVIRKGSPAIYGAFLSTISMKSGAPMAGTPEVSLLNFMVGQMARHYQVPWRCSGGFSGSKILDAQAGYETGASLWSSIHAGGHYIWHTAGWLEGGLQTSVAKFVVDAEQCAMAHRMARGPQWHDFEEALAAIPDIGPGGHYLGHPHTQANFQTAFFMSEYFDNSSVEQWMAEGSKDTTQRALEIARKLLDEYEEHPIESSRLEALDDYMARRMREIPEASEVNTTY